ncbi:hypothetical protein L596_027464 [Steinernema carpocapsae]|uniref:Uncharacterized protein n=1 Tax=Steinernema carpocapsae TaxID=34508 RepID=A0A4U5LVK4_STECR|nr:hypothetical protein L596_027464 [Steinernema carpocapsae]
MRAAKPINEAAKIDPAELNPLINVLGFLESVSRMVCFLRNCIVIITHSLGCKQIGFLVYDPISSLPNQHQYSGQADTKLSEIVADQFVEVFNSTFAARRKEYDGHELLEKAAGSAICLSRKHVGSIILGESSKARLRRNRRTNSQCFGSGPVSDE